MVGALRPSGRQIFFFLTVNLNIHGFPEDEKERGFNESGYYRREKKAIVIAEHTVKKKKKISYKTYIVIAIFSAGGKHRQPAFKRNG